MALAAVLAATSLTPRQVALFELLSHDEGIACSPGQLRAALPNARFTPLGRLAGDEVVLASIGASCLCGAQNCPYLIVRLGSRPRELFSTFGIDAKIVGPARPLAPVTFYAHDSALVAVEATAAFRDGAYAVVSSGRIRWSDNARKPDSMSVRFAAGGSSAHLHGTASLGWGDVYAFFAAAGQRVIVRDVASRANVSLTLFQVNGVPAELHANQAFVLPKSGEYRLDVDTDAEHDAAYALTLEIR